MRKQMLLKWNSFMRQFYGNSTWLNKTSGFAVFYLGRFKIGSV